MVQYIFAGLFKRSYSKRSTTSNFQIFTTLIGITQDVITKILNELKGKIYFASQYGFTSVNTSCRFMLCLVMLPGLKKSLYIDG